jgi:hypothetical protein
VEFCGEGVELADNALKFMGEVAVLSLKVFVVVGMMGVGVAKGFNLKDMMLAFVQGYSFFFCTSATR